MIKQNPVIAILLILIILATSNLSNHPLIRNILGFLIIYMIVKGMKIRTQPIKILFLSLVIIFILEILGRFLCKRVPESFENMDELVEKLEDIQKKVDENDKKKGIKKKNKKVKDGKEININDIETIEVDDDSDNGYNNKDADLSDKKVNSENYSPLKAQQETFKLLNTVRELKTTMEELGPSLSTAKDILGAYKQIKV